MPTRNLSTVALLMAMSVSAQGDTPQQIAKQIGLSEKEVRAGWIALFDHDTTFGFDGARVAKYNGRVLLQGGTTTTAFADYEVRAEVVKGGVIKLSGQSFDVKAGIVTLTSNGKRGPIELGNDVVVASLDLRPLDLPSLFNGKNLDVWQEKFNPKLPAEKRAKWTVENGVIHALGGPGALEYAPADGKQMFGDFIAQITVRTRRLHTNGGFFFRNQPGTVMMGYEAQLHNKLYDQKAGEHGWSTGAIDDRQHARRLVAEDQAPFVMTVVAHGNHIATWVNGYQTTDWTDTREANENPRRGKRVEPGTIQLQAHDPETDLEFLAIRIK